MPTAIAKMTSFDLYLAKIEHMHMIVGYLITKTMVKIEYIGTMVRNLITKIMVKIESISTMICYLITKINHWVNY